MKKKLINIICCLVILSICIPIGILLTIGHFDLSMQISIIDALTLLATVIMAFYVTTVLEKEVQDVRIQKELYIAKITELEQLLGSFETLLEEATVPYQKVNRRICLCRLKKHSIFKAIKGNFKQIKPKEFEGFEKDITDNINILRKLFTETSVVSVPTPDISMKNNILTYSQNRIEEILTVINITNENFFKLKIRINNL
ncbi:MAG: hypothetical protein FWC23_01415 [Chitinispirillia bacterium]|nr:hypothetical protein [Chitinispirillia bacterium]MCL2267835.1 hypothetical protein [Chitinispirillia bacterium]